MFKSSFFSVIPSGSQTTGLSEGKKLSERRDSVLLPEGCGKSPLDQLTDALKNHPLAAQEESLPSQRRSEKVNLSDIKDIYEVIDAVKKLLQLTELSVAEQREMMDELWIGMARIIPGIKETEDKSLIVSLILQQANDLNLDQDSPQIAPLVMKLIATINL